MIFALLGLYLLGQFNFAHYGPADRSVGVTRFFLALCSFSFTIYLIPGLRGAPLKGVSAFVPRCSLRISTSTAMASRNMTTLKKA